MKSTLTWTTLLAVTLAAPAAFPCGAPFGSGINIDPAQDIVVVHKDGVETYVFQPRFCGSAKEFGLVLPVPGKLTQQPALSNAKVFSKLIDISQPLTEVVTVCSYGNGAGGSTGASRADAGSGAAVVSSGTVGFMDYAQLETSSVDALTTWLDANGYPYDSVASAAFDYYVQKGWLFLTFKINQGVDAGASTCKDLGPVKFSFPSEVPVVPTRMATARSKDSSGVLSYASNFSWRIFGITGAGQQIGFQAGSSSTRTLNFSGALDATETISLDGLAMVGDRMTKLTVTFSYGSTDPDVGLALGTEQDYRETVTQYQYVSCSDGGVEVGPNRIDGGAEAAITVDAATHPIDVGPGDAGAVVTVDAGTVSVSLDAMQPPESSDKADAGVVATVDAAVSAHHDAAIAKTDAPAPISVGIRGSGCSFLAAGSSRGAWPLLVLGSLLLGWRRRRGNR